MVDALGPDPSDLSDHARSIRVPSTNARVAKWQTHQIESLAPLVGLEVQVLSRAPLAQMAKMVYAPASNSGVSCRHGGSTPPLGTSTHAYPNWQRSGPKHRLVRVRLPSHALRESGGIGRRTLHLVRGPWRGMHPMEVQSFPLARPARQQPTRPRRTTHAKA